MKITQILNLLACGLGQLMGTGLKFCRFNFKQPAVLFFLNKGHKFAPTDTFDLASLQLLQQKGIVTILKGVTDFVNGTPENDRRTFASTGKMTDTLLHPYMWTFTLDNGLENFKAQTLLASNEAYDFMMADVAGNILLAKDKSTGGARGLDLGLLSVGAYVIGNENSNTITVQVDRSDFDKNVAWIQADSLNFTASQDLDGYNNVDIVLVAPADGDTTINFSVLVGDTPKKVALEGLEAGDLLLQKTVAGVTTTIAKTMAAGLVAGDYVLTVAAVVAGEVYSLTTHDAAVPSYVINLDGDLYKSPIVTTVVVP